MNLRVWTGAILSTTILALGCGGAPEDGGGALTPGFVPGTRAHLMPKHDPSQPPLAFAAPNLQYYGGHVVPHAKVVTVFWGTNVASSTKSQIGGFYSAVTDSQYFDWLLEYDTDLLAVGGQSGTNQHIGRGSHFGSVTITPSIGGSNIDDTQIQSELDAQITAGKLPAPDANTVYMTYFAPGVTITQGGYQSCQAFCAYHNTFTHGATNVAYGVLPDFGPTSQCAFGCGANANSFDNLTSASSHELIEAVTDAEIGLAQGNEPPMAWYDNQYGEIGDICNGQDDTVAGYIVQTEWSNTLHGCIAINPAVPTPTPTPPPTPTPNPGGHKNGLDKLTSGCGCTVSGDSPTASILGLALIGALVAMSGRRRR